MLVLPNSTTVQDNTIFHKVCEPEGWTTPESCQPSLWWYNGAIDSGAMALTKWDPNAPYSPVSKYVGINFTTVERLTQYPLEGVAQTVRVGRVDEFPVLYACGSDDSSDLCKSAFDAESAALIGSYTYLKVVGFGHDVLGCSQAQTYIDAIIKNIQQASHATLSRHDRNAPRKLATLQKVVIQSGSGSAVCNDGSPYAYYLHAGTSPGKWVFFQMGGSYCWDEASCNTRKSHDSSQMSSHGLPATLDIAAGIISDDASDNPFFSTWNKVQLPYCTSDAFSGTVEQASWSASLSFLGSRVVPSVIADLKRNHGLVDSPSTTVIYSGASAGAVGMYPNLDLLSSKLLPSSRVVGVVDSGWFLDSAPFTAMACADPLHCAVEENLVRGLAAWNSSVDADCAAHYPTGERWRCMMGHYVEPFISTPLFVFEWQFDLAQMVHDGIDGNPSGSPATLQYAQHSRTNLTKSFAAAQRHHHFFSPACYQHVVLNAKHADWVRVAVNGTTLPEALNEFVKGTSTASILLDQCATPDCNPTCPPPQHIG